MRYRELSIEGGLLLSPDKITDSRGCFYEAYRPGELADHAGHPFTVAQTNFSVSAHGVLRGIHGTLTPPGQAKVVTCHRGAVLDVIVDLRQGSPTFGRHQSQVLRAESGAAVYLAEGLGHAFLALTDDTCVGYLCSTPFVPGTQIDLDPFDPHLAIDWGPAKDLHVSEKDRRAPGLAEAARSGLLPRYDDCLALYERLRRAADPSAPPAPGARTAAAPS
ncbi:dTDP-4-dehydrorhamnose 3,5-epimerase family protein [Streptomyces lydicus]|uniref:dTDP-4-dehydrorhamnose 3,5-epimerase family protein n=1 Tax=Streptomyces lydicus TaxID=47763 RepID=UPI00340F1018